MKAKVVFWGKADHLAVLKTGVIDAGLHWNSASVKQRAGYVTLKEMDSFFHMALPRPLLSFLNKEQILYELTWLLNRSHFCSNNIV